MLKVIINIEAGNDDSNSTFIVTSENCVRIGYFYFIHSEVFKKKFFTGTQVSEDF